MKILTRLWLAAALTCAVSAAQAQLTLAYCLEKAGLHYPAIRKYAIVEKTSALDLADINKAWLPQATVYAQGTVQNAVPQFPAALQGVMQQMGGALRGLGKEQYRMGVDVTQTVWDGGATRSQREAARAKNSADKAALDVEIYAVRERVESLFFGLLLLEEQMKQTRATLSLLEANLQQMKALQRGGAATKSDADMVEAQHLSVGQQLAAAEGSAKQYRAMLKLFMGESTGAQTLVKPDGAMPEGVESNRPELSLFDARRTFNNVRLSAVKASLRPKIGLFGQAFYGYPGFDNFAAMRNRDMSFNALVGVKISWNIASLYSRRNDTRRVAFDNEAVEADREKFLFENNLATARSMSDIATLRSVMADDNRIAELRASVRRAAESQLRNGVIDATALLSKITDENRARLNASYHEVEMLRLIYQLKNTLNR